MTANLEISQTPDVNPRSSQRTALLTHSRSVVLSRSACRIEFIDNFFYRKELKLDRMSGMWRTARGTCTKHSRSQMYDSKLSLPMPFI